ncbi:adenylate/guanylate cyclase domain-containing protein [Tardiphaga sp. 866_E4_N2_1]|uniref:adenylate/guanylate cyclase domain-containing protein n=1 Tax=unclassified Tardiphaga TaxID=2631404 RepID=UPI003F274AE9
MVDHAQMTVPVRSRFRIGFRTSIIALFVGVVLTVGLALVYLSFSRVNTIIRTAASSYLSVVAQAATDRIDAQLKSVHDNLDILRGITSVQSAELKNNPRLNILLASMLRNNKQLFSLYMGYEDGSFLEMDLIDRTGAGVKARFGAPDGARFRLFTIVKAGDFGPLQTTTAYLDDALRPLASLPGPVDFDPRVRPWYRGAFEPNASLLTEPYIFYQTGDIGYTLRMPIVEGQRGVVAGDILLSEAEAMLRKQQLGHSGVAYLFDDADRVLAHPEMSRWLEATSVPNKLSELPRLSDVDTIGATAAIKAWRQTGVEQQFFDDGTGRAYAAAFRPVEMAGSANLRVGFFAPLDEFYAEIEQEKRTLFILAFCFVIAAVPIAFWIGNKLSLSLRILAREVDRIQNFRFSSMPQLHSPIREIDDLGRSVFTMRTLVQTFSNFVPKRLVQQLVETGTAMQLGGERREATILFTDVENFTGMTENEDPTRVMLYTSRYFAAISDVIATHQGTVDKYIGDAVMGLWNAPIEHTNHVAQACAAVLDCVEANRKLNEEFEREGWPVYKTRFGLHVGDVMIGNIGSPDRMNYTALGATVNLASRLETLNKDYGTSVLVSEAVKERVDSLFLFRSVARIKPKGFAAEVQIYELLGARDQHSAAASDRHANFPV